MNFSHHTDNLMKPFLKSFGTCGKQRPIDKTDQKLYKSVLSTLYKEIYQANATIFKDGCFQSETITVKNDFKQPEGRNT